MNGKGGHRQRKWKLPRKYAPGILTQPARVGYNNRQSAGHNFIREVIAMSLRKVAGIIALLAVISVIGGGGNYAASPVDTLGLFRLASLCPFRPDYGHPGIPGRKSGQNPLLRP